MVNLAQRTKDHAVDTVACEALATTLHDELADALERLSQDLVARTSRAVTGAEPESAPNITAREDAVRFLGQVAAAWADIPDGALPPTGAGFGSTVVVEDLDQGVREMFTLMTGDLLDIDRGQVSLASPIGQALLGAEEGDVVSVQTPHRLRTLRVVGIRTLQSRIEDAA